MSVTFRFVGRVRQLASSCGFVYSVLHWDGISALQGDTPSMVLRYLHDSAEADFYSDEWEEFRREGLLTKGFSGKTVLYVLVSAAMESTGCGCGSTAYIAVPGFVVTWKSEIDNAGRFTSKVEPVTDDRLKAQIRELLLYKEGVKQIRFW